VRRQTTAAVGHRKLDLRLFALCAVLTVFFPGCKPRESEAQIFQRIDQEIQAAEYDTAGELARASWMRQPGTEWGWRFKSQYILVLLFKNDKDRAAKLLQDQVPAAFQNQKPRYQYLKAYLCMRQRDVPGVIRLSESAFQMAKTQGDFALENEALVLKSNVDDAHSLALLSDALAIARQHHLDYQQASTLSNLGYAMLADNKYSDGISYLLPGSAVASRIHARSLQAYIQWNLGECYLNLGNLDQALSSYREALAQVRDTDPRSLRAGVNLGIGKIYSLRQENTKAITYFKDAFAIIHSDDTLESYVPTAQKLAAGLAENHQALEAEKYNELAHQALVKNHGSDSYHTAFYELNRGDIAAERNQLADAEACYQNLLRLPQKELSNITWLAHARLAELSAQKGSIPEARKHFESALTAIEENRSQQKTTDQITFLSALIRFYQQYVDFLVKQGNRQQALAVADSSRASVLTRGLQSSRKETSFITRIKNEARNSNTALLFYWLAPQKSYLWLITPKTEAFQELPPQDQITQDVQTYSKAIQAADQDLLTTPNPAGLRLFETLIKPVSSHLEKGMRIVIVPDGALHGLNFETLLVKDNSLHYWLNDVSITVAPSFRILLYKSSTAPNAARALIIGDGDYSSASGKYPPLPESKKEVSGVSALFPNSTVLTKLQAVPEAYEKAQPGAFSLIHFSAHVEANENSPLDSAIILSPGQYGRRELYARDLMNPKNHLNADLVTISGCNSVGKKVLSGEGMVGFAWAAFEAGARNAVTSLWEVDDRSTTELMNHFYTEVTHGKSYAEALREAKLHMLEGNFKKPYYWAPFQIYSRNLSNQ